MKHYRLILADGVYHYADGESARQVRIAFARNNPTLPKIVRVIQKGFV